MARVLVVDEDDSLSNALSRMLCSAGYEAALTGPAALTEYDRASPDVVLLDLILPGVSGMEVLQRLQARSPAQTIRVTAGEGGELLARIRAETPAGTGGATGGLAPTLTAGPVRMDVEQHVVTVRGAPVRLPLKEFQLLETLLRNAGRILTRGQLIAQIWGRDYVGDTKTLDVHVRRLRSKIELAPSNPRHLVNVRSLGFKFEP